MKIHPALFAALFVLAGSGPAEGKDLSGLVDQVMAEGSTRPLAVGLANALGFGAVRAPARAMRYSAKETPDRANHIVYVVFTQDDEGKRTPTSIIFLRVKVTMKEVGKHSRSRAYRAALSGELLIAFDSMTFAGKSEKSPLDVEDAQIQGEFLKELDFLLSQFPAKKLQLKSR